MLSAELPVISDCRTTGRPHFGSSRTGEATCFVNSLLTTSAVRHGQSVLEDPPDEESLAVNPYSAGVRRLGRCAKPRYPEHVSYSWRSVAHESRCTARSAQSAAACRPR